jgi:hypothetical protein
MTTNVVHLPAQRDIDPPQMINRDVALAAVHAVLAALPLDQAISLTLAFPGLEHVRLMLEAMPDDAGPDDVMDEAIARADVDKLKLVYELFGDRLRRADDHADALLERGDTALVAAYLPPLLPQLRRPVELFQKLLERGDEALFRQMVEHQAHCRFDADDLEQLSELADEAASRHRDARPHLGAEATARAAALHAAATGLRDAVSLRQLGGG